MESLPTDSALTAAAFLAVSSASILLVAVRLGRRCGRDDRLFVALIVTLLCIAQAVGVPLVLGMLAILTRVSVLIAHVLIAAVVLARVKPAEQSDEARAWSVRGLAALGAGTVVTGLAAAPTLRGLITQSNDTLYYHLANAATWLQSHSIWPLPYQNPGFYTATHPGNGEMFGLWLILPTHGDQLAYLAPIPFGILCVLAVAAIARELGGDARTAAFAAVAMLGAPISFWTQAHSLSTDLAATSGVLTAVAFLLRARRAEATERTVLVALGGVALGLGLGSKYSVLVPSVVVALWVLATVRPWRAVAAFIPGLLLFSVPWFARNALRTGNPLFPQDLKILGAHILSGGFGPLDVLRSSIAQQVREGHWDVVRRWVKHAARQFGPTAIIAIGGILASVRRSPRRAAQVMVALFALVSFGAYAITPYTGGGPQGLDELLGSNQRYVLTAVMLAIAVGVAVLPEWLSWLLAGTGLAYDTYKLARGTGFRTDIDLRPADVALSIIAALVVIGLAWGWPRIARARPVPEGSRGRVFAAGIALVVLWLAASGIIGQIDRSRELTVVERTVAAYRNLGGRVIVMGVNDVRSVLGPRLDTRVVSLQPGRRGHSEPYTDPDALTAALEASDARILVIPVQPHPVSLIVGWKPPSDWRVVGGDAETEVYVRTGSGGG